MRLERVVCIKEVIEDFCWAYIVVTMCHREGYILLRSLRKTGSEKINMSFIICNIFVCLTLLSGTAVLASAGGLAKVLFSRGTVIETFFKPDNGLHGVWVTTVANKDFPSKKGLSAEEQKKEADKILDKVKDMSLNTIFLQVRPGSDALYKSSIYPWSAVLTGEQGKDPGYDPLLYFIDGAHKRGLKLFAWINPYRVQTKANLDELAETNPAKINQAWTVTTSDGQLYYDPGIPDVRKMIEDGIMEIVNNYNVDGIVFDDYFYPEKNFSDSNSYKQYGGGKSIEDFRRDNVNKLVSEVHSKIKSANPKIEFGISPVGVWANKSQSVLGCSTKGAFSSYYDQYADTRLWVKRNWVDFICPQIYWSIGDKRADYSTVLNWWSNTVKGTDVKLYVAHAVYKQGSNEEGWRSPDQIILQLREAIKYPEYKGSVFFDYADLLKNVDGGADAIAKYYKGKLSANSFGRTLEISSPKENTMTNESKINIVGYSDANYPLLINGVPADRSPDGYFCHTVNLSSGTNEIKICHKGVTKTLYVLCKAEVLRSVQPQNDITADGGSQINITATAHVNATVYATVHGTRVDMTPVDAPGYGDDSGDENPDSDYVTYMGTYTLPDATTEAQDLGKISVTALWGGLEKTLEGAHVKVNALSFKTGQSCIATIKPSSAVNKQYVETFIYADNLYRPVACPQLPGSWDYVETNSDGTPKKYFCGSMTYYRLSCGLMLYSGNLTLEAKTPAPNRIKKVVQSSADNGRYTEFTFDFTSKVTYNATTDVVWKNSGYNTSGKRNYAIDSFNANYYTIYFFNTTYAANINVKDNSIVSSASVEKVNDTTYKYTFKLKRTGKFFGTNVYYNDQGKFVLDFKNPWDGNIKNLKVSIDAGHGGVDYGAAAGNVNEKTLNLDYALTVRDLLINKYGLDPSNIYMTRTTDTLIAPTKSQDLQKRTLNMINFGSDLSICIHQNDGGGEGFETYYFQPYSQELAACVQSHLAQAYRNCGFAHKDRGYKSCTQTAYYSCRQTQFPSVLVECGFIDNANDRGFLTSKSGKDAITQALAKSIVEYANTYMR